MCNEVSEVEWSGILMYKLIGNFSTGNFHCVVKDIFLMDIGNSAYTEYEFSERFIKYRMEHPESLEWETAHVHSHNSMSTFFSTTDMDELKDNAPNHNYYLSLIVNNAFEPKAKIAFIGKQTKKEDITRSFVADNGRTYTFKQNKTKEEDVLFVYNCEIEADLGIKVDKEFSDRLEEVILDVTKREEEKKKKQALNKYQFNSNHNSYFPEMGEPYSRNLNLKIYDSYTDFEEDAKEVSRESIVEELLASCLMREFNTKEDLEEAFFKGNVDFKKKGSEYVAECGTWMQNMGPYMLGYSGEYELKEEDLQLILEMLIMYGEEDYPELTEALTNEFVK